MRPGPRGPKIVHTPGSATQPSGTPTGSQATRLGVQTESHGVQGRDNVRSTQHVGTQKGAQGLPQTGKQRLLPACSRSASNAERSGRACAKGAMCVGERRWSKARSKTAQTPRSLMSVSTTDGSASVLTSPSSLSWPAREATGTATRAPPGLTTAEGLVWAAKGKREPCRWPAS